MVARSRAEYEPHGQAGREGRERRSLDSLKKPQVQLATMTGGQALPGGSTEL